MVEKHVLVICVAVGALALAAAVLGIVGEATNSKSFVRYDGVNCVYRRTPAFGCGIVAAASLLTGQIVLTAATGCWDRCRTRGDHRCVGAVFSSLLSWFLAILSACAFLVGAFRNESGSGDRRRVSPLTTSVPSSSPECSPAPPSSLVAAAIGIASYIALEATASSAPTQPPPLSWEELRQGVAMGQPQSQPHQGCPAACPTCGSTKADAGTV